MELSNTDETKDALMAEQNLPILNYFRALLSFFDYLRPDWGHIEMYIATYD